MPIIRRNFSMEVLIPSFSNCTFHDCAWASLLSSNVPSTSSSMLSILRIGRYLHILTAKFFAQMRAKLFKIVEHMGCAPEHPAADRRGRQSEHEVYGDLEPIG